MQYSGQYSTYEFKEVLEQHPSYQLSIAQDCQSKQFFTALDLYEQMSPEQCLEATNLTLKHFYLMPFIDYGCINRTFFLYPRYLSLRDIINNQSLRNSLNQQIFKIIQQIFLIIIQIGQEVCFVISLDTIHIENIENNSFINVKIINCFQSYNHESSFYQNQTMNQHNHIYALSQLWQYLINLNNVSPITTLEKTLMQMMSQQHLIQHQISSYISLLNLFIGRPSISEQFIQQFEIYQNVSQVYQQQYQTEIFIRNVRMKHHGNIAFISDFLKRVQDFQKNCRISIIRRQLLEQITVNLVWKQIQEQSLVIQSKISEYQIFETNFANSVDQIQQQLQMCRKLIDDQSFMIENQSITLNQLLLQLDPYSKPNLINQNDEANFDKLIIVVQQIPKIAYEKKFQKLKEEALDSMKQQFDQCKNQIMGFDGNFYKSEAKNAENIISSLLQELDSECQNRQRDIQNLKPTISVNEKYQLIDENVVELLLHELQNFNSACEKRKDEFYQYIKIKIQQLQELKILARNPQIYQRNREKLQEQIQNEESVEQLAIILDKQEDNYEKKFKDMLYEFLKIN